MNLQITNNNGKAQETFLKQLEGLALARDILTAKNLNKDAECDTITYKSCEVSMTKRVILPNEAMRMLSNLEALKEAVKIFAARNKVSISEVPKFHEAKSEPVELSQSAKETFARIGARAREAFIEEQIERANLYNVPYENYGDNYYQLMVDIDEFEYSIGKAKDLGIDWDDSEYDPVALEQAIEEQEDNTRKDRDLMYSDYLSSRRVTV